MQERETDVLVVGSGIAGLAAALAADRADADVVVATKAERPEEASTWWAQGGIAVTRDDPEQFKQDILEASAGTADEAAVDVLVEHADGVVSDVLVETVGIEFDGNGSSYHYGQEAAHDEPRILHVDAETGKHIHVPFLNYVAEETGVTILEDTAALELIRHEGRVYGALLEHDGEFAPTFAGATVLATGGIGALYPRSTNPDDATGDGIAMAALAGAAVEDMEFVQFHPTACDSEALRASNRSGETANSETQRASNRSGETANSETQRASNRSGETANSEAGVFLVSEAVRGEGALLYNGDGERFMPAYHTDAELAPRDVVARAVADEREATGEVTLDVSTFDFAETFPNLASKCEQYGVDWETGIPVAPAQHFLCGGIAVDEFGRTTLDRLYAVGECSYTGVHGANRLASTSLLEGLVWGVRAGEDATGKPVETIEPPELLERDPELPPNFAREKFHRLRRVMDEYVGIERSADDLGRAQAVLRRLKGEVDAYVRTRTSRSLYELRSATIVALLVARAAAENDESVGCHSLVGSDGTTAQADETAPVQSSSE